MKPTERDQILTLLESMLRVTRERAITDCAARIGAMEVYDEDNAMAFRHEAIANLLTLGGCTTTSAVSDKCQPFVTVDVTATEGDDGTQPES